MPLILMAVPDESGGGWGTVRVSGSSVDERTCPTEKDSLMASPTMFRTPYELRIELLRDTIVEHSKLDAEAATDLAAHVLRALISIPEKVR